MARFEVWFGDNETVGMRTRVVALDAESLNAATSKARELVGDDEFIRGIVDISDCGAWASEGVDNA